MVAQQVVDHLIDRNRAAVVHLHQQVVFLLQGALDFLPKNAFVEEVLDSNTDAVNLVGVGRSNTPTSGANLALTKESLGDLVQGAVVQGDHVGVRTHHQFRNI